MRGANMEDLQNILNEIDRVIKEGPYKDNWESLSKYQVPDWYCQLKFGIFIHWGVYSVPAFESEWYSRNMYIKGSPCYEYHIKTYGPHKEFGYKDFIPMFQAEKFQPDKWAELFDKAGAKYVIPVAEHHDGFQMYESRLSDWNAKNMGPKRDVLGELKEEVERRGMVLGASSHRIEHWFFMGHGKEFDSDIKEPLKRGDFYWAAMPEPNHQDLFSASPTQEFMEDWLCRCCEIVDKYQPRIIYFDWWIQHSALKPYLKKFAAYYYNRAVEWGVEGVVINYKHDAFQFGCAVVDIERGQFAEAKPYYWQTDTAIAKNSWCYTKNNDYKSAREIVCDLVDIVSKNGTLLLNVGPKADGTFSKEDMDVLLSIGKWLEVNGEAIYGSKTWRKAGEGPTKIKEGQFCDGETKQFTSKDIRFTVKGSCIYAIVLKWSESGIVYITELGKKDASSLPLFHGIIKDVTVLGYQGTLAWKRTEDSLEVNAGELETDMPVVIRVEVD